MNLSVHVDPFEARVLGVLIEKALTTPDQYPLTLNAATVGSNQKSNRDPVLSLDDVEVAGALDRLVQKYLARRVFLNNSRVEKYTHNTKDGLGVNVTESAILAELMLRGPQTVGELRTHVGRMVPLESIEQVAGFLVPLLEREFIRRLAPAPGSRAERYVQLLCADLHPLDAPSTSSGAAGATGGLAERVVGLEQEIERLRRQLEMLAQRLGIAIED